MLITTPSFTKILGFIEQLNVEKTYLTFRELVDTEANQVVIEDVGFREIVPSKYDQVKYTYELAGSYVGKIPLDKDSVVILTSGFNGLDVGFTLRLLDALSRSMVVEKISLIITSPTRDLDDREKIRFYAFSKLIGLFDIYFNYIKPGSFRYIYVDSNSPPQLLVLLVQLILSKPLINEVSLIHLKIKRFVTLLAEILFLTKLVKLMGECKEALDEYKYLLASINALLDRAPVDLWIVARKEVDKFRASIFGYRRLKESYENVVGMLSSYLKVITYGKIYTEPLVEPIKVFDYIVSSGGFSSIYFEDWFKQKALSITSVDSTKLVDVYSQGSFEQYSTHRRLIYSSPDVLPLTEGFGIDVNVLNDRVGEIIVTDMFSIPIIFESKVNRNYIPLEFYELYFERARLSLDQYYPRSLFIGENEIYVENIHPLHLMNYNGLKLDKSGLRVRSFNTLSSLLGVRFN